MSGSEIAAPNRKSLVTFHRTLKSQCSTASSRLGKSLAISGVRDGHRNRKNRKNRCDFDALSFKLRDCKMLFGGSGFPSPSNPCFFGKKSKGNPEKNRGFSLRGRLECLEKKGKRTKKAREIGKTKTRKSKKNKGIKEGQGN